MLTFIRDAVEVLINIRLLKFYLAGLAKQWFTSCSGFSCIIQEKRS